MNTKLMLTLLTLICAICISAVPQSKSVQWEYKTEEKCFDENRMNRLGSEGWELSGFTETDRGAWHCIFKRPK